jgi:hypothetical protein
MIARGFAIATVRAIFITCALAALCSCPNPLNVEKVSRIRDTVAPLIRINSPAEGSSYGVTVIVSGVVTDATSAAGGVGKVSALSYSIVPATLPGGDVTIASDGSFTFRFDTGIVTGPLLITMTATDWNANTASATIQLLDRGAIPSFKAEPGNQKVTLSWKPVPLSSGYTIYYTTDGSLPSASYGEKIVAVESPLVIDGLKNGSMGTFLLQSHSTEGRDNWSGYVKAIPLSVMTLAPTTTSLARQIKVEWNPIPGTDEFSVLRSDLPSGPFSSIAVVKSTSFEDTQVERERVYYFEVQPTLSGSICSAPNPGETGVLLDSADRIMATFPTPNPAACLKLRGGLAYVTAGGAGLLIVDVSAPGQPRLVGSCATPGAAMGICLDGDRAFVADATGLQIVDIADPSNPHIIGSYAMSNVYGVAVKGNYAYICAKTGFYGLDISSVSSPVLVFSHEEGGWITTPATDVVIQGTYAYLRYGYLEVYDLQDPASPVLVGSAAVDGGVTNTQGLAVSGTHAYVASTEAGLQIFDVSAPSLPVRIGTLTTPDYALRVVVQGTRAYVTDTNAGLVIVDITNPSQPRVLSICDTQDQALDVAVSGQYAYVTDGGAGLQVVDLAVPSTASIVFSIPTSHACSAIEISGTTAYAAIGDGGIQIFDFSNPLFPRSLSTFATPMPPASLNASAGFIYVTCGAYSLGGTGSSLRIIDASDPASPHEVGSYTNDIMFGVLASIIRGSFDWASVGIEITLFDVSVPASPRFISSVPINDLASAIAISGSLVIAGSATTGTLFIMDFADPAKPKLVGSLAISSAITGLALAGDYAFVTDGNTLYSVDISTPTAPRVATSFALAGAVSVTVCSCYALVACGDAGIMIFDVSNPQSPFEVCSCDTPGAATMIAIKGRYAVVADGDSGIEVIDLMP